MNANLTEKMIGDREFRFVEPLAMQSLRLKAIVANFAKDRLDDIFQTLSVVMDSKASDDDKTRANTRLMSMLVGMIGDMDPDAYAKAVNEIIGHARLKDATGNFQKCTVDGDFTGHTEDILPVVIEVLKVTLGPFFKGALARARESGANLS